MKRSLINSDDLYPHPSTLDSHIYKSICNLKTNGTIIVSTSYHKEITGSMAYSFIMNIDNLKDNVCFIEIPGAFELPFIIKLIIEKYKPLQVLALGCIIKGDTKHDEYLSASVINGIRNLSLEYKTPIINGVLTTETLQQAIDRAGKKYDKGRDFASTTISMQDIIKKINNE